MRCYQAIATGIAVVLSACTSPSVQADKPAVIAQVNDRTHAELQQVIQSALNNVPLALADNALTQDNVLLVERVTRRDATGALLNGRVLEKPERFTLLIRGSRCVLVQDSTQREWVLKHAKCVARPSSPTAP